MNAITKPKKIKLTPGKQRARTKIQRGFWTDETDAKLIRLRNEGGLTMEGIAEELGVTKNAVCGRFNRLGLSKAENSPIKANPKKVNAARSRTAQRKRDRKAAIKRLYLDEPQAKGDTGRCQWMHGEPSERNFCGHERRKGSSYCDHHHERCYIAASYMKEKRGRDHV